MNCISQITWPLVSFFTLFLSKQSRQRAPSSPLSLSSLLSSSVFFCLLLSSFRFSVIWEGSVGVRFTNDFLFGVKADSGFRMYLNGSLLLDAWDQGSSSSSAALVTSLPVTITGGEPQDLVMEYYASNQNATAQLLLVVFPLFFLFSSLSLSLSLTLSSH